MSQGKFRWVIKESSVAGLAGMLIWRRWSDISPEISTTGPFLVLSKFNGRLQAIWHSKAASY